MDPQELPEVVSLSEAARGKHIDERRLCRSVSKTVPRGFESLRLCHGIWRSPVAHSLWERVAAGSNPAIPTDTPKSGKVVSVSASPDIIERANPKVP